MNLYTPEPVVVIGEAVADAFAAPGPGRALTLTVYPGGGPANTAVGLARLGTPVRFAGRLSTGTLGQLLRDHLAASGVDLSVCVDATEPATLAVAALDAQGAATYGFYVEGTADWQWTAGELTAAVRGASAVHTGSLALALAPGAAEIERVLADVRPHATISVDPNVRPSVVDPSRCRTVLDRVAPLVDVLRLSEDDLAHLAPGASPADASDAWHARGVRLVVITLGAAGSYASLDGARVTAPAVPVTTVDTVGAGDAYTAGLLHRLAGHGRLGGRLDGLTTEELADAMRFAGLVAARTCAVAGADPPWAADLPAPSG